ncbi:GAF domain-containing sensor histidine kinase [Cyclobacterium plantarum]|uniref:histidine kinase n=1 Tax=Cyclobacterium plantarum TaxID=2716263 RepID=A0ABX0H2Y7_9BACT|nr:GAF domain-containing sensor histidine kinase [Cyclobacterium plantarum]NHE56166.1 GAF domain-containing sensor histidine kinase [Cyclobacterium plantarum]
MESPIPEDEFNRLLQLADYDLDNSELENSLKDLTKLAGKVAGTDISLVNLVDSFTQWTVASEGISLKQMPREDSVCQYTIMGNQPFEIKDLTKDERFKDKFYVTDDPNLRYYWGVPLKNESGFNLGALCVMDKETKYISPEKVELLEIIADEIVNRLKVIKALTLLKAEVKSAKEKQKQVAHDIRGPIGGIIGLAQIIKEKGNTNQLEDVLDFIKIIQKSGKSLLELADEILSSREEDKKELRLNPDNEYNLMTLKEKIINLYGVQAEQKKVTLEVLVEGNHKEKPFPKAKLLQILGNLISNAIKFTASGGKVYISLNLAEKSQNKELLLVVKDTGAGMTAEQIEAIMKGEGQTTQGSAGEKGYGFGLPLVKHLVDGMNGVLKIDSKLGEYARFELRLPV